MSNVIVATLKDGRKLNIGYNMGGYYPVFYVRKEWGVPYFLKMVSYLRETGAEIYLGSYNNGPAPYCYTNLTADELLKWAIRGWDRMRNKHDLLHQIEHRGDYKYKYIRTKHFDGSRYDFIEGIYTELFLPVDWSYLDEKDQDEIS